MTYGRYLLFIMGCVLLTGCRYISWGKDVFNQGNKLETYRAVVKPYIQATRIYDQLTTLGLFDAIWLATPVRTLYTKVYAQKHAFSSQQYQKLLTEQLEENKKYVSFYILAGYKEQEKILMTDPKSPWSVHLEVACREIRPVSLTVIYQLEPEYIFFFNKHWSIFKQAYLVKFDRKEAALERVREFALVFRRVGHEAKLVWLLDESMHALTEYRIDEDVLSYDINENI